MTGPSGKAATDAYRASGVDIDEGARLVSLIAPAAKSTARAGALGALGGFAASFDLKAAGFADPILLTTTDGVGTKLKIAIETGRHAQIGVDLVAMCVNDLLAQGAEPLSFLDYYACGKLDADQAAIVVNGIAEGCRQAGCALAGGETAEMPGMYAPGDYDLAGFALGAAERGTLLPDFAAQKKGDVLIALASSGPHSNGYSLIRKVVADRKLSWSAPAPFAQGQDLADALLTPTRIYVRTALPVIRQGWIKGAAHITGGGLIENPPRAVAPNLAPRLDWSAWETPPVFQWLQDAGGLSDHDLRRTFNCGIGFLLIASPAHAMDVLAALNEAGEDAFVCGELAAA
ncbi:MAG: phosphoribosylformylglycinamidine cyclo-ligase [Alphaproteobacteria bacterium]|nr:phosphoribosylformylglycinamidine cyclo-ligase [Alphaproteobacteria bacterium]